MGEYGTMRASCQPSAPSYSIKNMWSEKTVPKESVAGSGLLFGCVVFVILISIICSFCVPGACMLRMPPLRRK